MRKLDLRNYDVTQRAQDLKGNVIEVKGQFAVKDSVLNVLFLPALKLMGAALVRQNILAMKIEQAKDEIILEEEEYQRVKYATEHYPAQSRNDVEFVDRILNQTPEQK